ncbi:putative quinol monooxygenase [Daejeonella oryzae]|uniref:putative quinol monooxygenase n=1 Tax=Daejeonella oryzae TaxID=1122943 RepID=UPI00047905A7|nr:antibiotic biosynthesis monooxygenase [Daejeonella oryzae]
MKRIQLILTLSLTLTVLTLSTAYSQNKTDLIVFVKYKAQAGKDSLALSALKNLISKVKTEPNFVKINIHVDPADPSNILLYEHWSNEEYYKGDHMKTPHLLQFISDSRLFLAGPPDITFWKIND